MTDAPSLIDGETRDILGPRILAWLIDIVLVVVLLIVLKIAFAIIGLLTLGLGWLLFAVIPAVPFLYAVYFLACPQAATPGQQLMGLTSVNHATGAPPSLLEAFVSIVIFTLTVGFPPLLAVPIFTARHRMLHDLASGLLMVRTRPLTVRSVAWNIRGNTPTGSNA